jgi:membrane protease subunit HflK
VLSGADKIILDQKAGGQGVVPYIALQPLEKRPSQDDSQDEGGAK